MNTLDRSFSLAIAIALFAPCACGGSSTDIAPAPVDTGVKPDAVAETTPDVSDTAADTTETSTADSAEDASDATDASDAASE